MSAKPLKIFSWQTLHKYWTLWREELAESIQFQMINQTRAPQLIPTPTESSLWQAMKPYFGDGEATQLTKPTHPIKPTYVDVLEASHLGGT